MLIKLPGPHETWVEADTVVGIKFVKISNKGQPGAGARYISVMLVGNTQDSVRLDLADETTDEQADKCVAGLAVIVNNHRTTAKGRWGDRES